MMKKLFSFFTQITFSKAIILSFSGHLIFCLVFLFTTKKSIKKPETYSAIQVAVVGNFKDLPTISKKDSLKAVPESLGTTEKATSRPKEKSLEKKPSKPNSKGKMVLNIKNNEKNRTNIINRLKRIQTLREKSSTNTSTSKTSTNESTKGSRNGFEGIEGTTLAQASGEGIQNWYLQRAQRKIHANFQINPGFASNEPNLKTQVLVKLRSNGTISHIEISKSSGNKIYDDLVLGFVKQSAPFGNVPEEFEKIFAEDGVEFHFVRSDLN
jgi:outer membrane biosynthesis protein TonB